MKPVYRQQRRRHILIISLIFLILFLSGPAFSRDEPAAGKDLDRKLDPVIVIGTELNPLMGIRIDHLALLRYRDSNFEPIPFQVDERDKKGRFVLNKGKEAGTDEDEGCLDKNDELVFMARDLGDRAISDDWRQQYEGSMEIEVVDPLTERKGWAYLVATHFAAERSPVEYVTIESQNNISCVIAKHAKTCVDLAKNSFFTHISLRQENGEFGPNVVDRMKVRLYFKFRKFLGGFSFSFNEDSFHLEHNGHKDGPVRIIIQEKMKMKVLGITIINTPINMFFYNDYMFFPQTLKFPSNSNKIFSEIIIKCYMDFNHSSEDEKWFFSDLNHQPVLVNGVMSPAEQQLDSSPPRWMGLKHPLMTHIQIFEFKPEVMLDQKAPKQIPFKLYYMDDREAADPPEEKPGQVPGFGCKGDISKIGRLNFNVYSFYLEKYRSGDEELCLNILDHPLQVSIKQNNGKQEIGDE